MNINDIDLITLDGYGAAKKASAIVNAHIKEKKKRVVLLVNSSSCYPNGCVPLSGIIDYYKEKGITIQLEYIGDDDYYIRNLRIDSPYDADDDENIKFLDYPFDKVWTFESAKGENRLVDAFLKSLRLTDVCSEGTFTGLEWCLNETMDNVLNHSQAKKGFVMGQYHQSNKQFSVCIFDYGIGIYNSFNGSKYHPKTRADAITMALRERVTRDENIGQGNGLWGLHRIIEDDKGALMIISDGAYYKIVFDESVEAIPTIYTSGNRFFNDDNVGSTLIDFQMHTNKDIDVGTMINSPNVIDLWEESLENDNGNYVIPIVSMSHGTGTRPAAKEVRNIALNLAIHEGKKVIFDFDGIGTLGSSYADELIGKIISNYGLVFFSRKFEIHNIDKRNKNILERSVQQRMAQTFYNEKFDDDE